MPVQLPVQSFTSVEQSTLEMGSNQIEKKISFADLIPLKIILTLAAPYLAGKTAEEAIGRAHNIFQHSNFTSTLDVLGEDSQTPDQCEAIVQTYYKLIDMVKNRPLSVSNPRQQLTISFKPSMFSVSVPKPGRESERALEEAFDRITRVVDYAQKQQINMTLEAEDHRWANFHIEAYIALINAGYTNLGTVLQSRLFRTEKDVKRFDQRMRVRLVIGIYNEPAELAHTQKSVMKQLLIKYASELLDNGVYVELATHDPNCLSQFFQTVAAPQQISLSRIETQFLCGVPRTKLVRGLATGSYFTTMRDNCSSDSAQYLTDISQKGVLVRMYMPFGTDAVAAPYCRRRINGNPDLISYGIRNFFGIQ